MTETAAVVDERLLLENCVDLYSESVKTEIDFFLSQKFPLKFFRFSKPCSTETLLLVHTKEYIEKIEKTKINPETKKEVENIDIPMKNCFQTKLDVSTVTCQHTEIIMRMETQSLIDLTMKVYDGESIKNGLMIGGGGHHASSDESSGYCVYNHLGVTINQLLKKDPNLKILVFDWDVHHGNGNQEIFKKSKQVLVISMHRYDMGNFFPGKIGSFEYCGEEEGEGFNVNVCFGVKSIGYFKRNSDYLSAFRNICLPIMKEFSPDFIFIDSGFDSAIGDKMGKQELTAEAFALMTHEIMKINQKLIVLSNDGYGDSCLKPLELVTKVLLGEKPPKLPKKNNENQEIMNSSLEDIYLCLGVQKKYWKCLEEKFETIEKKYLKKL
eukprot:gene13009-7743_t